MKISYKIKKIYFFSLCLMIAGLFLNGSNILAQGKTLTGKIMDESNVPLAGATILLQGTNSGTTTNINGEFVLQIPAESAIDTVVVSFIGYISEKIGIADKSNIELTMVPDLQQVAEVVIVGVGYGTMRKSDLTGAISSVSSDEMKQGVISSSEQLLQGKIAGLTVVQGSGDPSVGASIRLRGGTSLTASNGPLIVVDGIAGVDFNTVQPSEIVSIDVLKDASAAAIYGSRGANGVIIVTTNRENKGKIIQFNSYVAFGKVARHLDLLSANQWRGYVREHNMTSAVDYGADTDWQKELEQTAVTQSYNVSFANANDNGGYRAAIDYLVNEGVIKRSKLNRIGGSVSGYCYGLNKKLKLDVGLHANEDNWNPIDNRIFERMYNLNPTIPVYNPDGTFTSISGTNYENPVEINTNRDNDNSRNRLMAYGKVEFEIISGLKTITNISYELNSFKSRLYKPTYAVMEGRSDKGYAQRTLAEYTNKQLETYLTYDKSFLDMHTISLLAGYSYLENVYDGFGAERRGYESDIFTYNNLAAGQDYRAGDVYSYKGSARLISFFGRMNYNYAGRYMLTGTLRRDGSSRFGDNNKWGLFPAVSLAWRVTDENFMGWSEGWLNNLKIRAGYGVTGNQDGIGEYKSLSLLASGSETYYDAATDTWKQSYGPDQNANPDLKWESTTQLNLGVDFTLFKIVNGTLEVYKKTTSDLLYTYEVPQPPYLVGTMLANVGELSNKGVELTLNTKVIQKKDFDWDFTLTLAHNKQVIETLSNQVYETDSIKSGSLHNLRGMSGQFSQIIAEGYAVGTFWGPKCSGLDSTGRFILEDDGKAQYLGDVQPDLSLGFTTTFRYKNIDLSIATYGMFGQKVLNATAMSLSDSTRLPAQNVPDSYLTNGVRDVAKFSSYWIEDASFFRIQSVTLGYNLSIKKLGIDRLRVYITGENLHVFTKYKGIDPEVSTDGLSNPGIDMFNYYPKPRTFSFGLNLTF